MNNRETLDAVREIRELNLSYIILAQRLLRENRPVGMFRLGLSGQLADMLSGFTLAQTVKLAASDQLLCVLRFNDHAMLSALLEPAKQVDITGMHTAILLAGQPAEQFV
jgi:flagellar transcriptional activator FlhD